MSNTRQQVPSNIYWRRRLTVLGGLVILIVVVVLIIVRPGFGGPGTPEPEPEVAVEVIKPPSCLPSQIELVAMTDQSSYDAGLNPQLWLGVTNTSSLECTLGVGTDQQRYVITSGDDQIWASDDCQTDSVPFEITLGPGETQETTALAWDRTRSTTETCDGERPNMPGGGASYHLGVSLGSVSAADTKQFLLN